MRQNKKESDDRILSPIQCVCTNLKMASRVVGRSYDMAVEPSGVNIVQYSILINISRYEPIAQIRLADHLEMERTTLYRALEILERRGLLKGKVAEEGVSKLVSLTPKGKEITHKAEKKWRSLHEGFIAKFGKHKLEEFNGMLAEVRDHFKEV